MGGWGGGGGQYPQICFELRRGADMLGPNLPRTLLHVEVPWNLLRGAHPFKIGQGWKSSELCQCSHEIGWLGQSSKYSLTEIYNFDIKVESSSWENDKLKVPQRRQSQFTCLFESDNSDCQCKYWLRLRLRNTLNFDFENINTPSK